MDEIDYEALIHSLGQRAVDTIGGESLKTLTVAGDDYNGTAHIEICLQNNSWAEQTRVIDVMVDLRLDFINDVSIEYVFVEEDSDTAESSKRSDYSYA